MRAVGANSGGHALKILIASDVFPPKCGGAGWSAYYLARALRDQGHTIAVVRPRFDSAVPRPRLVRTSYDGLPVAELRLPAAGSPLRRLWTRNVVAPRLLRRLIAREARRLGADLIHAQHAITAVAAVQGSGVGGRGSDEAKSKGHIPVVVTVRDYWPLCYHSTMQVPTSREAEEENTQHATRNTQHATRNTQHATSGVPVRGPGFAALARAHWRAEGAGSVRRWPLFAGWEWATARRRAALRAADATIAVSQFVADRLRTGKTVYPERLHVIPNLVDLPQVDAILAVPPPLAGLGLEPGQPFALFVGKLDPSKGAHLLPEALHAAGVGPELPVVFAGSGPLQPELEAAARERWLDFRFADWLDNADVLRLLHAATVLLFPSAWDEPLSRVLLEACAAGTPILALNTGGTPDILTDGVDGRLVADMDGFTAALRDLLAHPDRRAKLAAGARATAARRFAADGVVPQVEALYRSLL